MQALFLLLVSVVLLATIQFGYTAASSKWMTTVEAGHKVSSREHKGEGHNRHDHPYENSHHGHDKHTASVGDISEHIPGYHDSKANHKESENLPSYKPYVPPYIESNQKHGRYQAEGGVRQNELGSDIPNVRVERVERPRKAMDTRRGRNMYRTDKLSQVRQSDTLNDLHKGHSEEKHLKPLHKQVKGDKKHNKKSKRECLGDKECKGGCCVPVKNGKKFCKKASVKTVGDKCASSCVCQSELRCFVGEYKRNGETRVHKDKKRILGRCINPARADYNNGYFVDEIRMIA